MLRYARHIMLDDIGFDGQERLNKSTVLIVGMGGLGSPAAMYLAAAGIGKLIITDNDKVELSNLQRQIIHRTENIGSLKVDSAAQTLYSLNSEIQLDTIAYRLTDEQAVEVIKDVDIVLDCSDNYVTRQTLNRLCYLYKKPLVAAAAIRWQGMISSFDFRLPDSPCYACMFDPEDKLGEDNCATLGVISPLLGIMGSMQALEAIKLLLGIHKTLVGTLAFFDAKAGQWRYMVLQKNPNCRVCSQ